MFTEDKIRHLLTLKESGIALIPEAESYLQQAREDSGLQWLFGVKEQEPEKFPKMDSPQEEWVEFLMKNPNNEPRIYPEKSGFVRNKFNFWLDYCGNKPDEALSCLKSASEKQGEWPAKRWLEALSRWEQLARNARQSEQNKIDPNAPMPNHGDILCYLNNLEDAKFEKITREATWYLEVALPALVVKDADKGYDDAVITFVRKAIKLSEKSNQYDDFTTTAMNSSIGRATEIAIQFQYIKCPKYADGLHPAVRPIFDEILSLNKPSVQTTVARHVIDFYFWDRVWVEQKIIPLFLSRDDTTHHAMWEGYFHNARWTPDFIDAVKDGLQRLPIKQSGKMILIEQYTSLLMNVYVHGDGVLKNEELKQSIRGIDTQHLPYFLWVLSRHIKASENKGVFFDTVCKPFFQNIWPQNLDRNQSPEQSQHYLEIIFASDDKFPEAVDLLKDRLVFKSPHSLDTEYVLRLLGKDKSDPKESDSEDKKGYNYLERFPETTLDLLASVNLHSHLFDRNFKTLQDCLRVFKERGFENDSRYNNLDDIVQKRTN